MSKVIGARGEHGRRIIIRNGMEYHVTKGWRNKASASQVADEKVRRLAANASPDGTVVHAPNWMETIEPGPDEGMA